MVAFLQEVVQFKGEDLLNLRGPHLLVHPVSEFLTFVGSKGP